MSGFTDSRRIGADIIFCASESTGMLQSFVPCSVFWILGYNSCLRSVWCVWWADRRTIRVSWFAWVSWESIPYIIAVWSVMWIFLAPWRLRRRSPVHDWCGICGHGVGLMNPAAREFEIASWASQGVWTMWSSVGWVRGVYFDGEFLEVIWHRKHGKWLDFRLWFGPRQVDLWDFERRSFLVAPGGSCWS